MTTQSEQNLENILLTQLAGMGYERVTIPDEAAMVANLKTQLELHNDITLSDSEFTRILNHLNKGGVYDRAQTLREKMSLVRDDGTRKNIEFINSKSWCQNQFQVTNQVTQQGSYQNRYDVTILINGLPLVQIELKRPGIELKEAFNQVNRYRRHSFASSYGLYQYVQLFVISNGVNTKYYANTVGYGNGNKESFKFTSFWADKDNQKITELEEFARTFLEKCHLAKMITKYMVLTTDKKLLVLRPYQYYAVEAIIDRVKNSTKNGYIWHTTGSGKTLTSFKASQILIDNPDVDKVVFVVDRNDLDAQTIREFNSFKEGSVDGTDNTNQLVKQFGDDTKLIVTTIQKLNTAISREHHLKKMDQLRHERIVFIFDECHRSQFGETHKRITEYFTNHQLFGFTGTPIFADNASGNGFGKRTTAQLFDTRLHQYVITDAIRDENVLKFAVEYVGKYKEKAGSKTAIDIEVEGIDTRELMESPQRLEEIADYIIANHDRKTYSRDFTAMFAISNVDTLTKYYDILQVKKAAKEHNLKIATIFSYGVNEDDKDANGLLDAEVNIAETGPVNQHSRDKLEGYIANYNAMFGTAFSTRDSQSFYNYYRDIATRVKRQEIDILLVVNMFLTGFDSKTLNTLYVDKNLRYHGLLQAYSRTNRILDERKSQGNIVVFRNLRKATNDAIELFANKDAQEVIFTEPYEDYLQQFQDAITGLRLLAPQPAAVDQLVGEEQELAFIKAFRELLRLKNVLITFADFSFDHTLLSEGDFNKYRSKYLDLYDKVRSDTGKEKVSILDDVDFELELIRRDTINVDYIVRLLAQLVDANEYQKEKLTANILGIMSADTELRSKRELIQKFIEQNIPDIGDSGDVEQAFETFWNDEQQAAFRKLCEDEGIAPERLEELVGKYLFNGRQPRRDELSHVLKKKPRVLELDSVVTKLSKKLNDFIETFLGKE